MITMILAPITADDSDLLFDFVHSILKKMK